MVTLRLTGVTLRLTGGDTVVAPGERRTPIVEGVSESDAVSGGRHVLSLSLSPGEGRNVDLVEGPANDTEGEYGSLALVGPHGGKEAYQDREGMGEWFVTVPLNRGERAAERCYALYRGKEVEVLYRFEVRWDEENDPEHIILAAREELCRIGRGTRCLAVVAGLHATTSPPEQWVVWLDDAGVNAGISYFGWQQMRCELPFSAGRIVPDVLAGNDGGCLVLVASADGGEIALVQFFRPSEEMAMDRATLEEDEEIPELPVGRVAWRYRPATPFTGCAIGRGLDSVIGLALTFPDSDATTLHFAMFAVDEEPTKFTTVEIGSTSLPGCNPAVGVDREGRGHVVILVEGAIARMSFDRMGNSRLDRETEYCEEPALRGQVTEAGIRLVADDSGGPWKMTWAAAFEDGRCMANGVEVLAPVTRPLALLTLSDWSFLAIDDGLHIGFVAAV